MVSGPSDLCCLNEESIAALLGVSRRMVRKYVKTRGLPHEGEGSCRCFNWPLVREWYLLYRLEIVDKGGRQRPTLKLPVGNMRKRASSGRRKLEPDGPLRVRRP